MNTATLITSRILVSAFLYFNSIIDTPFRELARLDAVLSLFGADQSPMPRVPALSVPVTIN